MPGGTFVWIKGTGGKLVSEKWPYYAPSGVKPRPESKDDRATVEEHPLTPAQYALTLHELEKIFPKPETRIRCPQCGFVSYHPEDIKNKYCAHCHQFHESMNLDDAKRETC